MTAVWFGGSFAVKTASLFDDMCASQAGAQHVYGVECSAIADQAKRIVADNGYADRVTIIKGKVSGRSIFTILLCSSKSNF